MNTPTPATTITDSNRSACALVRRSRGIFIILLGLGIIAIGLAPSVRAACQQGCLANMNTVLGDGALNVNTGSNNTAVGWDALLSNTTANDNTAMGAFALANNTT